MKPWTDSNQYKKWKLDVKSYRGKTRKNNSPDNMCKSKTFCKGSHKIPRHLMPQIYDTKKFSNKIFKKFKIRSKTQKICTGLLKPS